MIIIIEEADLQLPDFPYPLIEFGKFHAKLIAPQVKPDVDEPGSFKIWKSIYWNEAGKAISKSELLISIEKSL